MGLFDGDFGQIVKAAASMAAPGAGQYFGQTEANQANVQQAELGRDFNDAQSRANREFQERMSSSAHQREVADLKAAGLNPIMSANAGSSTPAGSTASAVTADIKSTMDGFGSTAKELHQMYIQHKQAKENLELTKAQTAKTKNEAEALTFDAKKGSTMAKILEGIQNTPQGIIDTIKHDRGMSLEEYRQQRIQQGKKP